MNKKKLEKIFLFSGVSVLVIILIAIFGFQKTLVIFGTGTTQTSLVSQDAYSYTYKQTFSNNPITIDFVGNTPYAHFDDGPPRTDTLPSPFPYDANIWTYFNATDVQISGITVKNLTAICRIESMIEAPYYVGRIPDQLVCRYIGDIYPSNGQVLGQTYYVPSISGSAIVQIPKKGVQCVNDLNCPSENACDLSSHTCVVKPVIYYEFSNNNCNYVSKLSSQKLSNDYPTLSECQSHIIPTILVYRFQNNTCTALNIMETNKNSYDYLSSSECQLHVVTTPPAPVPKPSSFWDTGLGQFILNFLKKLFPLSITGTGVVNGSITVQPNIQANYHFDLTALRNQDTLESKTWQWGHWKISDSTGKTYSNLISDPQLIANGTYAKDISITTPSNIGNYALVSWITEVDATWNRTSGKWDYSNETIVAKEITNLQTQYKVTEVTPPTPKPSSFWDTGLGQIIASFLRFLGINVG